MYGWTPDVVLGLPMRLFWEFSGQVQRLQADDQRLQFQVGVSLQSGESAKQFELSLDKLAPEPVTLTGRALAQANAQPEPGAIDTLRALQG